MSPARSAHFISERMAETRGRTRGFDYLRGALSISVIAFHSIAICYGPKSETILWHTALGPLLEVIVPAFFALSGFLVAGSLLRTKNLAEFLTLRAVRILPALFFEVVISAMIVGPLLTTLPLGDYFGAFEFRSYWLNIVGDIHYTLPGVFLDNPDHRTVNKQLWTIPVELRCYVIITVAAILGIIRHRWRLIVVIAGSVIGLQVASYLHGNMETLLNNTVSVKVLYLSFLSGIAIYLFQDRVPLSGWLFCLSVIVTRLLLPTRFGQYLACAPVAYLTIYIGLTNPPPSFFSKVGDYSYGIYIYGFVVQQMYAALSPNLRIWWLNLVVSLSITMLLAGISWHFVESPILRQRSRVVLAVNHVLGRIFALRPPGTRKSTAKTQAAPPPPTAP